MDLQILRERYEKYELERVFEALKGHARNAIEISLQKCADEQIPLGASKFGGLPDLPQGEPWPVNEQTGAPLHFIAQINFKQTAEFDADGELPSRGMLYLFYDCVQMPWGYDPKHDASKKALYFEGEGEMGRRAAPFGSDQVFEPAALSFESCAELPSLQSDLMSGFETDDDEFDAYWLMNGDFCEQCSDNKILGHADDIQGGMELECELVANDIYCGNLIDYDDPAIAKFRRNVGEWALLLQIGSNDENKMMWFDCGKIYLWIKKSDLRERKFDRSRLVLQCG